MFYGEKTANSGFGNKSVHFCLFLSSSFCLMNYSFFSLAANMSITSHFVVSSISYYFCNGPPLSAVGCFFTSWCITASLFVPRASM